MDHKCSKCDRWGMVWDGRAKVVACLYHNCKHVIKLIGFDHGGIPLDTTIRAAIAADRIKFEDEGKVVIDLKHMRRVYYTQRARPETHELNISSKDSMRFLVEFYKVDLTGATFAEFVDDIKNGDGQSCYFKRILTNFFCDGPTQFVEKEKELTCGKRNFEADSANLSQVW